MRHILSLRAAQAKQFQSTHPHGVRRTKQLINGYVHSFNPRTHTGCDSRHTRLISAPVMFQSTHPHGVRREHIVSNRTAGSFNPRTHTGCDYSASLRRYVSELFQSTHPHGVRLCSFTHLSAYLMFQSTHPHGVRPSKAS